MSIAVPLDLITQFRALMFDYFPYISHYSYSLTPVPREGLGTMAVDKQGHMYFDPEWIETLTLEEGGYVACHEAWHLILRHCHRARQVIGDNPTPQQIYDLNIAADIIVWLMMEEVADMAPKGGVTYPDAKAKWPDIERNMTLGELYSIISRKEEQDKQEEPDKEGDKGGDQQEDGESGEREATEDEGDGSGTPQPEEPSDDCSSKPDDGTGSGEADEEDGSGEEEAVDDHGFPDAKRGSAADGQQRDYETETNDAWDAHLEESLLEKVEDHIEVLEACDERWSPSRGRIPGRLKRLIKQRLHPSVNPWNQLRDVVANSLSQHGGQPQPTFMVRNRRQSAVQKGVVLAGERKYQPKAAVIMDTSGSMTSMCLMKAAEICHQGTRSVGSYRLVCWDYRLQLDEIVKGPRPTIPAPGGGGTCMTSAINHVLTETAGFGKPDVIVCITDGGTGWPDSMPIGTKLVIALTQEMDTPDYAKTIRIPDPGKTPEEIEE